MFQNQRVKWEKLIVERLAWIMVFRSTCAKPKLTRWKCGVRLYIFVDIRITKNGIEAKKLWLFEVGWI